jgi:exosortase
MRVANAATERSGSLVWLAPIVLVYVWVLFFIQVSHTWLVDENYQYGWGAPLLFLYFFYRRWRRLPVPVPPPPALQGMALVICILTAALICPLRVVLEANPDWRPLLWVLAFAVVLFSLSAIFCVGGRVCAAHFAFPILFPLSAVPWPGHIEIPVTLSLMKVGATAATKILNAFGIVTVQHGTVLQTSNGFIGVDEACSGIKGLQAMVLIGLALSELSGTRGFQRFKMVALGWVIAFIANLSRITFLACMGALYGTGALEAWHDRAGTAAFVISGFLLVLLSPRSKPADTSVPGRSALTWTHVPQGAFAVCLAFFLAAEVLTWWWYRQDGSEQRPPWNVVWSGLGDSARPIDLSKRVFDMLQCDAGSGRSWYTGDGRVWVGYFFEWKPGIRAFFARNQHSPEICLPSSGRNLVSDLGYRSFDSGTVRFLVKHLLFDDAGRSLNVFFIVDGSSVVTSDEGLGAASLAGRLRTVARHCNRADRRSLELIAAGYDDPAIAWDRANGLLQTLVERSSHGGEAGGEGPVKTALMTGQ